MLYHITVKRGDMAMSRSIRLILPESTVQVLDGLVEAGVFSSRSEAIRSGIREILRKYKRRVKA